MESAAISISIASFAFAVYALLRSRRLTLKPSPEDTESSSLETARKRERELERRLIYDLVRETYALRETKIVEMEQSGRPIRESIYARVYEETALLTHNTAGPSNGWHKLFVAFRGQESKAEWPWPGAESWSELNLLPRLGFDEGELSEYKKQAHDAMHYT